MDSDDDNVHCSDVESFGDDDYYSEDAGDASYGGYSDYDDDAVDYVEEDDDSDCTPSRPREINYTILKESDIQKLQEDEISRVSAVLSISRDASSILLRHCNWSVIKANDVWFVDEDRIRKEVGLLEKPVVQLSGMKKLTCGICFERQPRSLFESAACGHLYCVTCWAGYIRTSINDGPGCLMLRCPEPSCRAALSQSMINLLASDDDKKKYSHYLLRSYIEENKKTKWCPAPGCEYAVKFEAGNGNFDVSCLCSHTFCWKCTEDCHRPVDCETVRNWVLKNSAESENTNWMLANSKPCPKCKRPIEKNHGCMRMTCLAPCKFKFCWLCLGPWKSHGKSTGGFYSCNRYEEAKKEGLYAKDEKRRQMAKNSLERYTHYYERWASNLSSRKKALSDLHQVRTEHIDKLIDLQGQPASQLKFITEAWLQIVECRRVLEWTYAYGFYLPEHENAKKQFFEYLQGQAESGLERLHQCAEKELQTFLNATEPLNEFNDFHEKLVRLTRVTGNYFENLVRALENGLSDVDSNETVCTSKTNDGGSDMEEET